MISATYVSADRIDWIKMRWFENGSGYARSKLPSKRLHNVVATYLDIPVFIAIVDAVTQNTNGL